MSPIGLIPFPRRAVAAPPPPPSDEMVLVFDTSLEAGEQITLPLYGTVDCHVDWGDGSNDNFTTTGNKTHTYSAGGTYTVEIAGTLTQFGNGGGLPNALKLIRCTSFGNLGLQSLSGAFYGASNLSALPLALPASVTDLSNFLVSGSSFNGDIGGWPIAQVTVMNSVFNAASSFTGTGLANWDLRGIASAGGMAFCFFNTAITTANYNTALIAWEANKANCRNDLGLHFGGAKYSAGGAAASARAALISYGWTISDGGSI